MVKRTFLISNFKSIKNEYLELNHLNSVEESFGGVLTLIGPNNSGKSNLLQALLAFKNSKFSADDFREEEGISLKDKLELAVSLTINNNSYKVRKMNNLTLFNDKEVASSNKINILPFDSYQYFLSTLSLGDDERTKLIYFINNLIYYFDFQDRLLHYEKANPLNKIVQSMKERLLRNNFRYHEVFEPLSKYLSQIQLDKFFKKEFIDIHSWAIVFFIQSLNNSNYQNSLVYLNNYLNQILVKPKTDAIDKLFIRINDEEKSFSQLSEIPDSPIKINPNIFQYDDKTTFSNQDLVFHPSNNTIKSRFYSLLFKLIADYKLEDLIQAYENFKINGSNSKSGLNNLQRKINQKLTKISNDFSNIYHVNNQKYKFEVELESDKVFFQIFEGNTAINLDRQSAGFKWFFNFYFNMYSGSDLESGDLVIMDEPATNLHVSGQIELLKFMREFGRKNNILFVISTHSPFLIDIDYLDEIRIIEKDEIGTHIFNKFNAIKDSQKNDRPSDITAPIRSSLTIGPNNLITLNHLVVFVEGITDYGYLIAMRNKLSELNPNYQRLKFIPFDGVTDDKKLVKTNISQIFLSIAYKPVILVDADGAGNDFLNKNKYENIEIITLKEIDESFKEIEDLFDPIDRKNLGIDQKKTPVALRIKNSPTLLDKLSKSTIKNFNLLFESLLK